MLTDEEAGTIAGLKRERKVKIVVKLDPTLRITQYDIVIIWGTMWATVFGRSAPYKLGVENTHEHSSPIHPAAV